MLRRFPLSAVLACAIALPAICTAAAASHPIVDQLTPEEFSRAGLQKLSPDELTALDAALARHGITAAAPSRSSPTPAPMAGTTAASASTNAAPTADAASFGAEQVVKPKLESTPKELRSRIEGTIEDISGHAAFALENGQVWQQRNPETIHFSHKLVNPEVVITKMFGGYRMLIVPANRVIFVKRIQ